MSKLLRLIATAFALSLAAMPLVVWLHERWAINKSVPVYDTRLGVVDESEAMLAWFERFGYAPQPWQVDIMHHWIEGERHA